MLWLQLFLCLSAAAASCLRQQADPCTIGILLPEDRDLTSEELLQRAGRIAVAEGIVRAETLLQEVRRMYHGFDEELVPVLIAHLSSALTDTRRGLSQARSDPALVGEHRRGDALDSQPCAARVAREGEGQLLPDRARIGLEWKGRPRVTLGHAAEAVQASQRIIDDQRAANTTACKAAQAGGARAEPRLPARRLRTPGPG